MSSPDSLSDPGYAHLRQIGVVLALVGLLAGFVAGFGALSGDQQGRVNLLFLLLVFAFLPALTLTLSLVFLLRRGGRGLAGWLLELPFWPRHLTATLLELDVSSDRKAWLVHQGQVLGLSFSGGCLFVYLLLLLGTDISFVWRSTVLDAADLLPGLQALALPWFWWGDAQPTLTLLEQTRDSRLLEESGRLANAGQWWRFILAAQLSYSLLPRSLLWIYSCYRFQTADSKLNTDLYSARTMAPAPAQPPRLADLRGSVESPWSLLVWGAIPAPCLDAVKAEYGEPVSVAELAPLASPPAVEGAAVVLVKSWEPPMAELADVLQQLRYGESALLLPVDWDDGALRPLQAVHQNEWRRFAATLDGWQVLVGEAS